ncbi:MAG: transcriptional regulator [Thermoplasmata archaeon]|nr:transcriptional regulator [Thermoplasmata archaeon]
MGNIVDEILEKVRGSPHENEVVEFKDRKTLNKDEMGEYFSALSNEANLKGTEFAWMIFGMTDDGRIVNSNFLDTVESQNKLKKYISEQTSGRMSYIDIHTRIVDDKRVLLFQIPAAKNGTPTTFKTFAYERQGDSVFGLSDEKRMRIMRDSMPDWSKNLLDGFTIDDLDPEAISKARYYFKHNHPLKINECDSWDDVTFLNKMGLTIEGRITYAAVVLLGNPELEYHMPDCTLKMRWILRDNDMNTIDNEFFPIPFITAIDDICSKIRNVKYEYFRPGTLFPDRMDTYEPAMLREILNNCVAHQDYRMNEYITIVEYDRDRLVFKNAGQFIPGTIEKVISSNSPASYYRNRLLAESMAKLGMVDVAGGGIIKMFKFQMARFFPLPEYDLSDNHVEVTITGKVIDKAFADTLMKNPKIGFEDVILLDKVQKNLPISDKDADRLRFKGFIEGRKPNYYISPSLASSTGDSVIKGKALKQKGFDDSYYKDLIVKYLDEYDNASKSDLCTFLYPKLPEALDDRQRYNKVGNLISALKREGRIINTGSTRKSNYVLTRKQ